MASSLRVNAIVPASGTNVAIGTAGGTITYTASVSGVSTFSNGIIVSAGTTAAPAISPSGDSNTGIFFPSADTIAFGEGGAESARFDSNGHLGIGTNSPTGKLDLYTTGSQLSVYLRNPNQNYGIRLDSDNNNSRTYDIYDITNSHYVDRYWQGASGYRSFYTNNIERVKIDSSGRVTMPYQPSFYAYQTAGLSKSTTGAFTTEFNTTLLNVGSCYSTSTGRFTAPVAGVYFFQLKGLPRYGTGANNVELTFYKNGSNVVSRSFTYASMLSTANHAQVTANLYISLAVNDYVQMGIYAVGAGTDVYYGENLGSFCGHLVG